MSLSRFAITRPVSTIMIFLAAMLIGVVSLVSLPVELYPNVELTDISIIMIVRGGIPPTEVESLVTKPIEEVVSTVSHLKELLSVSKEGEATIVLSFEPGTNMEYAALEVREKFAKVKNKLPKEAEKPIIAQFNQNDTPIVILAVTSDKRTTESLRKIVDENVKEALKKVSGVANVEVSGGRERKILVELDKNKMFDNRIAIEQVISKIGANNVDILSGEVEEGDDKYLIRIIGAFKTVDDIKNLPVSTKTTGSVMRLKDIAKVEDSYLDPTTYARMNIKPVVSIYLQKESTANTIKVAQDIMKEVSRIEKTLPKDIRVITTGSRADFIKTAIKNLNVALFQGAMLVMLVLYFFMGHLPKQRIFLLGFLLLILAIMFSPITVLLPMFIVILAYFIYRSYLRSILIVASAIPISLVITFGIMKICNILPGAKLQFSINFITMFGLALGVGMLVDNSIVVFENILRKIELGEKDRKVAAIEGASEMNVVLISSSLTSIIVFLPMIFLRSEMSLLYSGVAWTVTFSLFVSLFVSLAMVPLFASKIPISAGDSEALLKPICRWQTKILFWIMRRGILVVPVILAFLFLAFFMYSRMGKEFLGSTEQNKFTVFIEMPTGAKLDVSDKVVKKVEDILKEVPEVKTISARVESWSSKIYVELVGVDKRKRTVGEVIDGIRAKTDRLKPAFIYYEEEKEVGRKEIILDVFGYDYDILRELAISMATRLNGVKGFTDTKIRMRQGRPELGLKVDKQRAALYGLSTRDVGDSVHAQMRGLRATLYHTQASEVETITRLDEKYRKTFMDVHYLLFVKDDGSRVYLDQVADFKFGLGPSEIWRKNKSRMIQVSSNTGKLPLSKAVALIKDALKDIQFPENYYYRFGGDYPSLMQNQREFAFLRIIILALVYFVLASIFESYYQPLIIMSTVIFAAIGAIFALFITKTSIGMGALMGLMMLAGIVVNNGIILVDHINFLKKTNKKIHKILVRVSNERLRPVLMTSLTTIIGLVPLAIDTSEGSNLWKPLSITVIGGLLLSTPLTLLLTANIYLMAEKIKSVLLSLLKKVFRKKVSA